MHGSKSELSRAAMVILEQTAQALATDDLAFERADGRLRIDKFVVEPLMVSLGMIMQFEIGQAAQQNLYSFGRDTSHLL